MNDKLYKLMNWRDIEEIVYSECDNPHRLLGAHKEGNKLLVQAFFPDTKSVTIQSTDGKKTYPMECVDEAGYYAGNTALQAEAGIFRQIEDSKCCESRKYRT